MSSIWCFLPTIITHRSHWINKPKISEIRGANRSLSLSFLHTVVDVAVEFILQLGFFGLCLEELTIEKGVLIPQKLEFGVEFHDLVIMFFACIFYGHLCYPFLLLQLAHAFSRSGALRNIGICNTVIFFLMWGDSQWFFFVYAETDLVLMKTTVFELLEGDLMLRVLLMEQFFYVVYGNL